jgi:hypothetical protein
MGGNIADLKTTLTHTINAFNAHNIDAVKAHLADNVTVTSLRPRRSSTGPRAVTSLSNQFPPNDNANFKLKSQPAFDPPNGVATKATIKGTATWTDDNGSDPIQFDFECVFDSERGWLFQKVSASVVGGGH